MSRLGEVLIASQLVTEEQVAAGLRAQVLWGARLGTALVELGHVGLDDLATALGRQHRLPAALQSHFERADPSLRTLLSPQLAERFSCAPLLRAGKRIVVVSISPLGEREIDVIAGELGIPADHVITAIAPELRMRWFLETAYGIARPQRFLRSAGTANDSAVPSGVPRDDDDDGGPPLLEATAVLAEPIELGVDVDLEPVPARTATGERRKYLATLADMLETHPDKGSVMQHLEKISGAPARKLKTGSMEPLKPLDLGALTSALEAIEKADDRDAIAGHVVDTLARFEAGCYSALLLTVRGNAATSWTGFCRDGTPLPPLAVPLALPGLVPAVIKRKTTVRCSSGDLSSIDYLLLASLGVKHGDLVVVPIVVVDQAVGMIALAAPRESAVHYADVIATAAGRGLTRLMKQRRR